MAGAPPSQLPEAVDFALSHGLIKLAPDGRVIHAPFTLDPFELSEARERGMAALTAPFNALAWRTANAPDFLRDQLTSASRGDAFLARLLKLGARPRPSQPLQLAITRSDYFLAPAGGAGGAPRAVQVELNTIAASYPALSGRAHALHRHLHRGTPLGERLVENDPIAGMAAGIADAVARYGVTGAGVLLVVQTGERNVFDQRLLEFRLREAGIVSVRASLEEIGQDGVLRDGHLAVQGRIAAVTYLRAGYGPEDYRSEAAWAGRERIEASATIAVPTASWQLAGSKKIQQVLTRAEVLARYCPPEDAARLANSFAGLYELEEAIPQAEGAQPAWRVAMRHPGRFVLKPQREGGGNNLFDGEMRDWLERSTRAERDAYILMERLRPLPHPARMASEGVLREGTAVSEIGRFGVFLADGEQVLRNEDVGYLVRTKPEDSREGGVSAGYGFLGSLARLAPG